MSMPCFQEGLFEVLNLEKYAVLLRKQTKFCTIQCFFFHLVSGRPLFLSANNNRE